MNTYGIPDTEESSTTVYDCDMMSRRDVRLWRTGEILAKRQLTSFTPLSKQCDKGRRFLALLRATASLFHRHTQRSPLLPDRE